MGWNLPTAEHSACDRPVIEGHTTAADTRRPLMVAAVVDLKQATDECCEALLELNKRLGPILGDNKIAEKKSNVVPPTGANKVWLSIDEQTHRLRNLREVIVDLLDRLEL